MEDSRLRPSICTEELREELLRLKLPMMASDCRFEEKVVWSVRTSVWLVLVQRVVVILCAGGWWVWTSPTEYKALLLYTGKALSLVEVLLGLHPDSLPFM